MIDFFSSSHRGPRGSNFSAAALAMLFLLPWIGCGTGESPPPPFTADAAVRVSLPDLDRQESATRDRLSRLHAHAESTLDQRPLDAAAVAKAYGELGAHLAAIGFYEAAADSFETARRADPESFRWPYFLGVVRQDDSKWVEAVDAYADAIRLQPDHWPARLRRMDVLIELDRIDEAAQVVTQIDTMEPEPSSRATLAFARARIAAARGEHEQAVELFQRTLELDPTATAAHYPLSQAYLRLGKRDLAERHLRLRGDRSPTFDDPLVAELGRLMSLTSLEVVRSRVTRDDFDPVADLGFTLANLGEIGGAPERMESLLVEDGYWSTHPEHEARFRYLLGGLWVARGRDLKAEPHFRRATELDGSFNAARTKLGNLWARQGRFEDALDAYSTVLRLDPESHDVRVRRAAALDRLGRRSDALEDLRIAYEHAPSRSQAAPPLAALLDRSDRGSEADAVLRDALSGATEPTEQAVLHLAIADRLSTKERFDEALEHYARALGLQPDLTSASLGMASVLGHLGRLDEAIRTYGDVLAQDPRSEAGRRGEVTALLLAGRYREAVRSLKAAIGNPGIDNPGQDDPHAQEWSHSLARLLAACPDAGVRNGAEALRWANQAFDARPSMKRGETLAMAHAESGDFQQAAIIQRNLIQEARNAGRMDLVNRLTPTLELYERRQAFHAQGPEDLIVSSPAGGESR